MDEPSRVVRLEFPWPPSVNHYWRWFRNRCFISAEGVKFREHVCALSIDAKGSFINNERLKVHIDAYPPDRRKRDLDNVLKALLDSIQHAGVYEDDNQIDLLTIKRSSALEGRVIVYIKAFQ
jgi:crossover junction endodeoxyribonuclease RusA